LGLLGDRGGNLGDAGGRVADDGHDVVPVDPRQETVAGAEKRLPVYRLGDDMVAAGPAAPGKVLIVVRGDDHHHGHPLQVGIGLESGAAGVPVHPGQVQVHEDQVGADHPDHVQGLPAVAGSVDHHRAGLEELLFHFEKESVVVHQENLRSCHRISSSLSIALLR